MADGLVEVADALVVIHAFQHCQQKPLFFIGTMPEVCFSCAQPLVQGTFRRESISCPWTNSSNAPNSVVIRLASGSFSTYRLGDQLHIGLCDNNGRVTHFDVHGICVDSEWQECMKIDLGRMGHERHWSNGRYDVVWDNYISIHNISWRTKYTGIPYHEDDHNCFDFVWDFLCQLQMEDSVPIPTPTSASLMRCDTKIAFTEKFVTRTVSRLLRYLHLRQQCVNLVEPSP